MQTGLMNNFARYTVRGLNANFVRYMDFFFQPVGPREEYLCPKQGLQTFLSEGRISFYITVQGSNILRNKVVSGYATFYQINKFFVKFVRYWQNGFAGTILPAGHTLEPLA